MQLILVLCVPEISSVSHDQAIFVDRATGASAFSHALLVEVDRSRQRFQRGGSVQGAVRPVQIVMGLVLAQDPPQMLLVPDEGTVQELTAASPIQRSAIAFIRGVRTLQRTVRIPASARTASKAAVKFDPRSRIMNLTRSACSPRSMSRFRACWVVHSPVGCGVARQDSVGLGAQELLPGRPGPVPGGIHAADLENLPDG
jgi:hypothetical protein